MLENIKTKNKIKGDFGENFVTKYLNKHGYKILSKNFKCNYGEIDIIFEDRDEIVFGEIKTRNSVKYGYPAESINLIKRKHIFNSSKYFLYINKLLNKNIRYDVFEVYINNRKPIINHIRNVFW